MWKWLDRLADESHKSQIVAGRYHLGYVAAYGALIGLYACAMAFHWAAAKRHFRAADRDA